jgi:hypothetical protein
VGNTLPDRNTLPAQEFLAGAGNTLRAPVSIITSSDW